jgi:transposase
VSLSDPITDLPSALARIAELMVVIETQAVRIAELEEKLRQNSSNSSKPPSSDGPGSQARATCQEEVRPQARRTARPRQARAHLAAASSRRVVLDRLDPVRRASTAAATSSTTTRSPHRHQVVDLPPIKPVFDECRQHARRCRDCAHVTVGPLPADMTSLGFGPGVDAMVGQLAGEQRLGKRAVAEAMTEVFGVPMSTGAVIDAQNRVSTALATPVADAVLHAQNQPVKNADETPWWQGTTRAYLWVCVTSLVTVFQVHLTRKADAAKALLGKVRGVLGTDRYSGYAWWPAGQRQVCWAHLVRDFTAIAERGGTSGTLGEDLLEQAATLFDHWHAFKAGRLSRATLRVYLRPVHARGRAPARRGPVERAREDGRYLREAVAGAGRAVDVRSGRGGGADEQRG